jgi:hypothetical protein
MNTVDKQPNVLFYSLKCKTCNVFMTLSQNNNILKHFKLICIDGQEKHYQQKGLKIIPTIIIKNLNEPIEGKNCINWLENIIKMRSNNMLNNNDPQYLPETGIKNPAIPTNQFPVSNTNILKRNKINIIQPPVINKNTNNINTNSKTTPSVKPTNQLFGFMENEMTGFSDNYAYLLVDNALPKSFLPPDKDLQIYTAPEGNKLDKKTQDMYLKNMENFRENDKLEFKKIIDNEHVNILQKK